ncbi:hypothetical protein AB0333_16765 [Citricoccus sp. NPDC079358]
MRSGPMVGTVNNGRRSIDYDITLQRAVQHQTSRPERKHRTKR